METFSALDAPDACPNWQTLVAYQSGRLSGPDQQAVSSHVLSCTVCDEVLSELSEASEDGLSERLADCLAGATAAPVAEPAYREMEAGAKAITLNFVGNGDTGEFTVQDTVPAGRPIGQYVLLGAVGHGGMGVVYRARHRTIRREVALKIIRAGACAGPDTISRFRTEGAAVARLDHPNVAQLYEFGEFDGLPYYTMEWVGGGTLAAKLADGPLLYREAATLMRTLAAAMGYAHDRQVIHRDLKPSNVLLAEDGTPKIADFGLAKLLDDDPALGLTASNAILGTPSYMAVEQAEGRADDLDPRTDVYALGAILYETLTGRPPFLGKNKTETLQLVLKAEILSPSTLRKAMPADLEAVCLKCLERDPARRYESATALADDLGRWLAGEPTVARPLGWFGWGWRAVRRRAVAIAACLVLATGALGATAIYPQLTFLTPALSGPTEAELRAAREKIEGELDKGRPVTLVGEKGPPAYYRVWDRDDKRTKLTATDDGAFTVSTWSECVMELLPDPRHDSYRFRIGIRHETSDTAGKVGMYFLDRTFPAPGGGENHQYARMTYNDLRNPRELVPPTFPAKAVEGVAKKLDEPNRVMIGLTSAGTVKRGMPWSIRGGIDSGAPFMPAGGREDSWRNLEITVTPTGVSGTFDGRPVGILPAEAVVKEFQSAVANTAERYPNPSWDKADTSYRPRGGIGIILYKGTASFRSAEVSPLVKNP